MVFAMKQLDLLDTMLEAKAEIAVEPEKPVEKHAEKPAEKPRVFTVSDLNGLIKSQLEDEFSLIWVQGEISNFKPHTSGHFYFSLKDRDSQISCVMFRGFNSRLKFKPENGVEVLIRGKVTVYEPRGNYQVFCELMEPVGAGALQFAFEQLKKKLQSEGLFDEARKRALPALPKHIALVTSPTGAAVKDMLNVLNRRFKALQITVVPVLVQGDKAAASIVKGLQLANQIKDVEVIICGRGGGSAEDMWCFNEEIVARAIANSAKPVISAVGHEIDFTIADFVADLRAPTPSAAAELVVRNAADLQDKLEGFKKRLLQSTKFRLQELKQVTAGFEKRLVDPQRRLQDLMIRCDELSQRLESAVLRFFQDCRRQIELATQALGSPREKLINQRQKIQMLGMRLRTEVQELLSQNQARLQQQAALLDSLSPLKVLDRGYSIVRSENKVIRSIEKLAKGDELEVQFATGKIKTKITEVLK